MKYQKKTYIKTCIDCIAIDSVMKMEKKELSTGLFKREQIQNEENKYIELHKH